MPVTKKDLELLHAMSLDARASLTALAKKTGISKQALSYRLKLLIEEKILLGTQAIINTYTLGQTHYRLFIKFRNMNAEEEQQYRNYLDKNHAISWYAVCDGDYDSAIIVWAHTVQEYEQTYKDIIRQFGKHFDQAQFSIATEINYYKHNYLTGTQDHGRFRFGTVKETPTIDETDHTIITVLNKDARTSLVALAQQTGISAKAAHDRIKRLRREGIILGFHTRIDHKKLGFTHRKVQLWLNDTTEQATRTLTSYLKEQPQTIFTVSLIGGCDYEFELMTKTNEEHYEFMKKLRTTFPELIARYGAFTIYEEPKTGLL